MTYRYVKRGYDCTHRVCKILEMPWLVITIIFEIATTLWHIYLILVVRQHWLNRKHGHGDAKK